MCFSCALLPVVAGEAGASAQERSEIVASVYREVLGREPDAEGLAHHARLLGEGKDERWLREALANSGEGKRLAAQKIMYVRILGVALASGLAVMFVLRFGFHILRIMGFHRLSTVLTDRLEYIKSPHKLSPCLIILLILLAVAYIKAAPPQGYILLAVVSWSLLAAIKLPRWLTYGLITSSLTILLGWAIFEDAQGSHDPGSDRDDAVEIAAANLLNGSNPWSTRSTLNLPITTGPSSILLALAFVEIKGKVDLLTFIMWWMFFLLLLSGDVWRRNDSYSIICLLMVSPLIPFLHTLHWGLDELFYAAIILPGMWFFLKINRFFVAGLIAGFVLLSRLSYVFALLAFGLWWLLYSRPTATCILRFLSGLLVYVIIIAGMFYAIGGPEILERNFLGNTPATWLNYYDNPVSSFLSGILNSTSNPSFTGALVVALAIFLAAWPLRKLAHPFYRVSLALALSHMIPFSPGFTYDYQMIYVIPALYGWSFSSSAALGVNPALPEHPSQNPI